MGLMVIDTVTTRRANLHEEIAAALDAASGLEWSSATFLAAIAYRTVAVEGQTRVETWPESLTLGTDLPTLPLWLGVDLCLPVSLEGSYLAACYGLRIGR